MTATERPEGAAKVVRAKVVPAWCRFNRRHLPRLESADPAVHGVGLGGSWVPADWAAGLAEWNARRAALGLPRVVLAD